VRLDVYLHFADGRLDEILSIVKAIQQQGVVMSKELDDLAAQVSANTDVEASALALIQGLAAQLTAAGTDPAKLNALRSSLNSSAAALAAAVAANTPTE